MNKVLLAAFFLAPVAGCHTGDLDPMEQEVKLQEYESTRHFDNESAMRTLVLGTVPRERDLSGPPQVTAQLLELGHEKFNQMCTPCHGLVGDGKGSVAHKFSLRAPPSLHDARRLGLKSDYIYRVITEGFGLMPRFTTQLDTHERWAVVAYVRALQHSQNVSYDALPADLKEQLDHPKAKEYTVGEADGTKSGQGQSPDDVPGAPGAMKGDESGAVLPPVHEEAK
ncbi:MAG: cytochrome c [Polyangia bacterium]